MFYIQQTILLAETTSRFAFYREFYLRKTWEFLQNYWIWAAIAAVVVIGLIVWLLVRKTKSRKGKTKSKRRSRSNTDEREQLAESDYRLITERILQVGDKYKSILFAAAGIKCLPVTIPVNTAIELAGNKKRCLLIDLDLKRDAVAKAFGIADKPAVGDFRPRPCATEFKDLLVWPAHNFAQTKQMNIKPLVEAAIEKFDLVLINAPYLDGSPDRSQIAAAAQCAFIFTQNTTQAKRLAALIKTADCKLIGNIQINQEDGRQ